MATRKVSAPKTKRKTKSSEPTLLHRINALLHTVRVIAQHEDELCTLLHAARTGKESADDLQRDLRVLLEKFPVQDFSDDLDALQSIIPAGKNAVQSPALPKKKASSTPARKATAAKSRR